MADYNTLYTALKQVAPYIQDSQALRNELQRRASQGADVNSILNDAQSYSEVGQGAKDYFAPDYAAAKQTADQDTQGAQKGYDTLTQSIKDSYNQRYQNDPYLSQGIRSGQADNYALTQQTNALKGASDDYTTKLSNIAQRLGTTNLGINRDVGTLESTTRQALAQGPQTLRQQASGSVQGDKLSELYNNPFLIQSLPDNVLKQILQSYGVDVTD